MSSHFTHGSFHVVFEIVFDDGDVWVCRVRHVDPDETSRYLEMTMESTVATMMYVKSSTTIPVPEIYCHQYDPSRSAIGSSYIMMQALPGRERDSSGEKLVHSDLETIYTQIARSAVELASLSFPLIGRLYRDGNGKIEVGPFINADGSMYGPFSTSHEYYEHIVEKYVLLNPVSANRTDSDITRDKFANLLYSRAAKKLVLADAGPFGIIHGDYGTHNLLFDDNLTLTGVIDWDSAHSAPALACCDWPALVHIRWPLYDKYWPGVLEKLLERQNLYREGVRAVEQILRPDLKKFEGCLMSDIIGSDAAVVAQILYVLDCDPSYKSYDGRKVFEYVFSDADFETTRYFIYQN
jgi:hypothetical protein